MDKLETEMANQTGEAWHARPVLDVIPALETGQEGLSDEEALRRLERCGPNRLPSPKRQGPLLRFLTQFNNVLIYVLLGAAIVTALLGHWIDAQVMLSFYAVGLTGNRKLR